MVRRYVRKSTRGCWDDRAMVAAMNSIQSGKMGYLQAAKVNGVPKSTLRRIMKKLRAHGEVNIRCPLGSKASIFTAEEEKDLLLYLYTVQERLFVLTNVARRKLAYQFALKHGKSNKWKDNIAGREWLRDFLRRNDQLNTKIPEPTTSTKILGFNKQAVMKFYDVLGDIYNKYQLTADRIYNCDETSITCDQKSQGKVMSLKGSVPTVAGLATPEVAHTITVEVCMSATGVFMPLLFVFPRSQLDPQFTSHLILPCYTRCHDTGLMESDAFVWWVHHFAKFSRATKEHPVLLLLDSDSSHLMNIELLDLGRDNGVIMLCLPPHCTHKLQPVEVEFFPPLSKHYGTAVREWSALHPGQNVTIYQIPMLFEQAFIQTATMATALVAFRKTGIWPFNPHIFGDHEFVGAEKTHQPQQPCAALNTSVIQDCWSIGVKESAVPGPSWKCEVNPGSEIRPVTSGVFAETILGEPQNNPSRKRPYQIIPPPMPIPQHCPVNDMDQTLPGPSWKPMTNPLNEMRLATSSAYVEAVLGCPQNHPQRNLDESEVPGHTSELPTYSIIPHMFI